MGETTVGHVAGEVVRALYGAGYMNPTYGGQYRKSIRALERPPEARCGGGTRGLGGFAASTFSERTGGFQQAKCSGSITAGWRALRWRLVSAVRFGTWASGAGVALRSRCVSGKPKRGHGALGGVSRRGSTGFGDGGALPSDGGLVPHVAGISWGRVVGRFGWSHVLGFLWPGCVHAGRSRR